MLNIMNLQRLSAEQGQCRPSEISAW